MMTWLWVNLAAAVPFVLAVAGIPLWLVITRPDAGPQPGPDPHAGRTGTPGGRAAPLGAGSLPPRA